MSTFALISILALAVEMLVILLHFVVFGRRRGRHVALWPRDVRRFSLWSVLLHLVAVAGFVVLLVTGAVAVLGGRRLEHGAMVLHLAAAPAFAVAFVLKFVLWVEHAIFEEHDVEWMQSLGGYLGGPHELPADRFNAGQKAFFWAMGALALVVMLSGLGRFAPMLDEAGQRLLYHAHRWSALCLALGFVVHFYLATVANPGTLLAIITGRVSADWAKHHHPLWWSRIKPSQKGTGTDEE